MEDFYQILGVNQNATQDEIKKAYRKLAVEHHPDKGGDENKFKKISESYDTIGDEKKRAQYDNQKRNPFANMGGGGGGFNPFEEMFNQMHSQRKRAVPDKIVEVVVGAVESYNGSEKNITYTRSHNCGGCNGTGGERINCGSCGGSGFITQQIGTGLFTQIISPDTSSIVQLIFGLEMMLVTFVWFSLVSFLFSNSLIKSKITKFQHRIEKVTGVILIALGIKIAMTSHN